jgi:hypothetical protein
MSDVITLAVTQACIELPEELTWAQTDDTTELESPSLLPTATELNTQIHE